MIFSAGILVQTVRNNLSEFPLLRPWSLATETVTIPASHRCSSLVLEVLRRLANAGAGQGGSTLEAIVVSVSARQFPSALVRLWAVRGDVGANITVAKVFFWVCSSIAAGRVPYICNCLTSSRWTSSAALWALLLTSNAFSRFQLGAGHPGGKLILATSAVSGCVTFEISCFAWSSAFAALNSSA